MWKVFYEEFTKYKRVLLLYRARWLCGIVDFRSGTRRTLSRGKTGVRNRTSGIQTWSLRMAADRLKTKDKKRYQQTGSEER